MAAFAATPARNKITLQLFVLLKLEVQQKFNSSSTEVQQQFNRSLTEV
jgi:hypothetical protein